MAERVLVVAAHPDDEVLGCGGTIARLTHEGREVFVAILGEGATARSATRAAATRAEVTALQDGSRRAAKLLGVKELFLRDLPDNRFDTVPLLDVVKLVEELIERLQPRIVYTHHGGDLNIDHAITARAVLTATRPLPGAPVKELLMFEVPSSTEWAFQQHAPVFRPTVFADVAATLETKIEAMALYDSEARAFPHPRSADALRAMARRWGSVVGVDAAEAFELVRIIR
jgi:LmbE family N-acetylglucosaminyl deacetylase